MNEIEYEIRKSFGLSMATDDDDYCIHLFLKSKKESKLMIIISGLDDLINNERENEFLEYIEKLLFNYNNVKIIIINSLLKNNKENVLMLNLSNTNENSGNGKEYIRNSAIANSQVTF